MPTDFESALELIQAELADDSVLHRVGYRWLAEHTQPRRVVWVPRSGRFVKPRQGGSDIVNGKRQTTILTRREDVDAHIFADSDENVETLFENVVAAIYRSLGASAEIEELGQYTIETNDAPGPDRSKAHDAHSRWLSKILFTFPIRYSMTGEISKLTTIEAFETTDKLNETVDVVIEQSA